MRDTSRRINAPPAEEGGSTLLSYCQPAGRAVFPCPRCGRQVLEGCCNCPDCGADVSLMAAQLLWGPLYFNDALVYARYGEYEAALRNLLVARRLLPGHAAVYLMLVKVEALRRRFRQAREWVAEAYRNRVLGRAAAEELLSGIAELTEARCLFLHGLAAPWVRLLRRVWSGIKHVS